MVHSVYFKVYMARQPTIRNPSYFDEMQFYRLRPSLNNILIDWEWEEFWSKIRNLYHTMYRNFESFESYYNQFFTKRCKLPVLQWSINIVSLYPYMVILWRHKPPTFHARILTTESNKLYNRELFKLREKDFNYHKLYSIWRFHNIV